MSPVQLFFTLFFLFFRLGFFSFGGGYVMIPMIDRELEALGIPLPAETVADIAAIAGMAPGPVVVNAAVGFGYQVAGLSGVLASFLGAALPCAGIVILVASLFRRAHAHPLMQGALYGLRPVIVGIIAFAAVNLALRSGLVLPNMAGVDLKGLLIAAGVFAGLKWTKIHPVLLLLAAAGVGILL